MDLIKYLEDQKAWSKKAFGPDDRKEGIIDHIKKELIEIQTADNMGEELREWVDVIILALDGAWRCGYMPWQVAAMLKEKQDINAQREWPNWKKADQKKAIEHIR